MEETARCPHCGLDKDLDDFHRQASKRNGRTSWCKTCVSQNDKRAYRNRTPEARRRMDETSGRLRKQRQRQLMEYLADHPCVDCGEDDPIVLDFDHVLGEKEFTISKLVNRKASWGNVLAEIAKCEVRCANCHRRRTAKQFDWHRIHASVA